MAEQKPKPYSRSRTEKQATTLKEEQEQKPSIREELKPKKPEPKPPEKVQTKGGKEWDIVGTGSMYKIQFKSGGQVPEQLSGLYTKHEIARQAIRSYEATKG